MNSIFDIFKDIYGNGHSFESNSLTMIYYTGLPHKFNINRLRKDLNIEQRIIAYRFRSQLDLAIEIEPIESLIF
jgi:hypothetical protein